MNKLREWQDKFILWSEAVKEFIYPFIAHVIGRRQSPWWCEKHEGWTSGEKCHVCEEGGSDE